ncbi:MAG: MarR family transcriptional regulator, partial [Phycisphaerae bacterium]|nr:MarR family transcriptional regulator [Phycisphaerae bacterium]
MIQRTADVLMRDLEELLKPYRLSPTQYHVLRILRSARPEGLACHEITARMSTHDPDMTRLLDRLEARRLLARQRQRDDRRVIRVHITPEGLALLRNLDEPVRQAHKRQLGHIGGRRLALLQKLLT